MTAMGENEKGRAQAEELLIQKILAGEKDLFHELVRPYERGAYLLAYSLLANQADAEEVVQQAMLKIYLHLGDLSERYKFKPWAVRIVENEARMYRRKLRPQLYEPIEHNDPEGGDNPAFYPRQFADWHDLPSETLELKEIRQTVTAALAQLPEMYREVFVLRDVEHLNIEETCAVLGASKAVVKSRHHRARLMLRELLAPHFAKPTISVWDRFKGRNPWLAARR